MANNNNHSPVAVSEGIFDTVTVEELSRIIADANANPKTKLTALIVQYLSRTGMHYEKLMTLKRSDIDQDTGAIRLSSDT